MTEGASATRPSSPRRRAWRRFAANRGALVGGGIVLVIIGLALFGPWFAGDPSTPDIDNGLSVVGAPLGPRAGAWLGSDPLGRDVWARIIHGAAVSLEVSLVASLIALTLGLAIGLVAGYAGGLVDTVLMRFVDLVLAFPFLLLALLLAALLREAHLSSANAPVFITLGVVSWTTMARVIRGKVQSLREAEFVHAARAIGAGPVRILVRHLLPNVIGVVVVLATIGFAQMILAESVLSYVGLGPPPPAATWGRMLYEGQAYYRTAPWLIIAPGVAILLTVVGFNLLGEGLRDALDPKDRR
ncbi:MAG: ABC transporter permease [Deltaproteobacteria bacterium]|nr:ABC transporter permease [Deltaproteobacteria bacterium]